MWSVDEMESVETSAAGTHIEEVVEMKLTMVRYQVKPEKVAENEELVRAVYDELSERPVEGLRYGTFRSDDGGFVHLAWVDPGLSSNPLLEVPAFQRFTEHIGERAVEPPVALQLDEVGSFRFLRGDGGSDPTART
jgi:hypothetical protein